MRPHRIQWSSIGEWSGLRPPFPWMHCDAVTPASDSNELPKLQVSDGRWKEQLKLSHGQISSSSWLYWRQVASIRLLLSRDGLNWIRNTFLWSFLPLWSSSFGTWAPVLPPYLWWHPSMMHAYPPPPPMLLSRSSPPAIIKMRMMNIDFVPRFRFLAPLERDWNNDMHLQMKDVMKLNERRWHWIWWKSRFRSEGRMKVSNSEHLDGCCIRREDRLVENSRVVVISRRKVESSHVQFRWSKMLIGWVESFNVIPIRFEYEKRNTRESRESRWFSRSLPSVSVSPLSVVSSPWLVYCCLCMLSLREWAFAHVEKISKEESSSLSLLRSIGILLGAEERETASPHFSPKFSNRAYVYNWISKSSCYFKAISSHY